MDSFVEKADKYSGMKYEDITSDMGTPSISRRHRPSDALIADGWVNHLHRFQTLFRVRSHFLISDVEFHGLSVSFKSRCYSFMGASSESAKAINFVKYNHFDFCPIWIWQIKAQAQEWISFLTSKTVHYFSSLFTKKFYSLIFEFIYFPENYCIVFRVCLACKNTFYCFSRLCTFQESNSSIFRAYSNWKKNSLFSNFKLIYLSRTIIQTIISCFWSLFSFQKY